MIGSRKGILSLPIKLTVSFLILSLMVPSVMAAVESIQEDIGEAELEAAAEELGAHISRVHSKTPSYRAVLELLVPEGAHLEVGGDEGYVIRMFDERGQVGRVLMDVPVAGDTLTIYGSVILELSNGPDGVGVREL